MAFLSAPAMSTAPGAAAQPPCQHRRMNSAPPGSTASSLHPGTPLPTSTDWSWDSTERGREDMGQCTPLSPGHESGFEWTVESRVRESVHILVWVLCTAPLHRGEMSPCTPQSSGVLQCPRKHQLANQFSGQRVCMGSRVDLDIVMVSLLACRANSNRVL